ncbi:MAG: DUF4382 domain-containing protein [Bacteroidota bacterium]
MKNKHIQKMFVATMLFAAIFTACQKEITENRDTSTQNVSLYLTDGPGLFDNVFLDIQRVEVLVDTSDNTRRHDTCDWDRIGRHGPRPDSSLVWRNLGLQPAVYDVLALRNGVDTLLASANIPRGDIRLIRIDLGTNNSVVLDSVTYPLLIPPGADGFILVKLRGGEWEEFGNRRHRLWLDFDVQRSIVRIDSNTFYLRPVLSHFIDSKTGSIEGKIAPKEARAVITAGSVTDTAYAITGKGGEFKIRGLQNGTYSVSIKAYNGYKDSTISNIVISNSKKEKIGTITLHK